MTRRPARRSCPAVEALEDRVVPAVVQWDGGPSGTGTAWETAENWAGDVPPGPADDVVIGPAFSAFTIRTSSAKTVRQLTTYAPLGLTGVLEAVGVRAYSSFRLGGSSGDGIRGAVLTMSSGTTLTGSGTLDGVTIRGTVQFGAADDSFGAQVVNGLTLDGTVLLGHEQNGEGQLFFHGSQTISGSGTIEFQSPGRGQNFFPTGGRLYPTVMAIETAGDTLTLGPGVTITSRTPDPRPGLGFAYRIDDFGFGSPPQYIQVGAVGTIVNRGAIVGVTVRGSQLINEGRLEALDGDRAPQAPTLNRGLISLPAGTGVTFRQPVTFEAGAGTAGPGSLTLENLGTPSAPVPFEALAADLGLTTAGFATPSLVGTLRLVNSHVRLADANEDAPGFGNEAAYADTLVLDAASTLNLNGLNLYAHTIQNAGTIAGGSVAIPPDLSLSAVDTPAPVRAGEPATFSWTVANTTDLTIGGPWEDALYLSLDRTLDPTDRLLAAVPRTGPLGPNSSYTGTVTLDLPGVEPGAYYLIVDTDRRGQVDNGRFVTNNARAAAATFAVTVPDLAPGVPAAGAFDRAGAARVFRVTVPAGGPSLVLTLDAASDAGVNEVAVSRGLAPDAGGADVRTTAATADQELAAGDLGPGVYYVQVTHRSGPAGDPFTLTATFPGLTLRALDRAAGSNAGRVTVGLTGTRFTPATAVALVAPDGSVAPAAAVSYTDPTRVFATFDLTGRAVGAYTVRVADGGAEAELPGAFAVTAANPGRLEVGLSVPAGLRTWNSRPSLEGVVTIRYANVGGTDLPAPLLLVSATADVLRWPDEDEFAASFQLLGVNPDGPAGVLPPGAAGTITLSMRGLGSGASVEVREAADPAAAIDWAVVRDAARPPTVPADGWAAVWANFTASVGGTVGQYRDVLAENATRLADLGERTADVRRLLGFELLQAGGSLPARALAGGIDAAAAAPGLGLAFGRQFLQPLDARYRLGVLGRGWATTGDAQLTAEADGSITILAGGAARGFRMVNGALHAAPGDYGVITRVGAVYTVREEDGTETTFRPDGRLDFVTDRNGNRVTYRYDAAGRLTRMDHSNGEFLALAYLPTGRLASVTDSAGRVTAYGYDPTGEYLTTVTDAVGTTTYSYETGGTPQQRYALRSVTAPGGLVTTFEYDAAGRLTRRAATGGAEAVTFTYDSAGGVTAEDATGTRTTTLFTDAGRVGLVRDALGREQRFGYDARGDLTSVRAPLGTGFAYGYDARGHLTSVTDPTGGVVRMTYTDAFGQLATLTDRRGNTTAYRYEADGDLAAVVYPDGLRDEYAYDATGTLAGAENRRDQPVRYTTDAAGRVARADYEDGTYAAYTYDARGNLRTARDVRGGVTTYEYDAADRLTRVTDPAGRFLRFTYDAAGRRATSLDQDGFALTYHYDAAGRLGSLTDAADAEVVRYTYDAAGRLARKDHGNGTATTYDYDPAGQSLRLTNLAPGGAADSRFEYTYDDLGRRTSQTTADGTTTYDYDANGQLTRAELPGGRVIVYEYDAEGNRTAVTDGGVRTAYTTNNLNQYTQVGDDSYTYDPDGNLTRVSGPGGTTTYTYDRDNHTLTAGSTAFEYDAFGQRVARVAGGVRTEYQIDPAGLGNVVGTYTAGAATKYTHGLGLESRTAGGATTYYDFDALGSTAGLTNAAGAVTQAYRYLPFGEPLGGVGTDANPFRFVGQFGVLSEGSDPLSMRARLYTPNVGRFTTTDPIRVAGGLNLYSYSSNAATQAIDPTGLAAYFVKKELDGPPELVQFLDFWVVDTLSGNESDFWNTELKHEHLVFDDDLDPSNGVRDDIGFGTGTLSWYNFGGVTGPGGLFSYGSSFPTRAFHRSSGPYDETAMRLALARVNSRLKPYSVLPFDPFAEQCQTYADRVRAEYQEILKEQGLLRASAHSRTAGSFDPNDLLGPAGVGVGNWLQPGGALPYTVRFENVATASAAAQEVFVTLPLDPDLDWTTFELGDITFGGTRIAVPAGRASYQTSAAAKNLDGTDLRVDIDARLDLATGVVTWTFRSVDPLTGTFPFEPLAGFLPPNDATGRGEGAVRYTVRPRTDHPTGTRLDSQASIVFDTNAAILTPAVFNTLDLDPPAAAVDPLPATVTTPSFAVSWGGTDGLGSGVATYTVLAAVDGGPFAPWLTGTTATSAVYPGADGHRYSFTVFATDQVGLAQTAAGPTQSTTVAVSPPPGPPPAATPAGLVGVPQFGVGDGATGRVRFFEPTGAERFSSPAFAAGAVRTAAADFTGDGVADLVVGTGPGSPTLVRVLDGASGAEVFRVEPFEAAFVGGVYVAAGDLDGDGRPELIVTPDEGGGPRVRVFSGAGFAPLADFFGIDDPNFRGGARPAVGDFNGDGAGDLVVAAGFGGGPRVAVFDGRSVGGTPRKLFADFFVFEEGLRNGAFVTVGDLDGDGHADLIGGGGPGGGPRVLALSGADLLAGMGGGARPLANFFAGDVTSRGGVRVAVKDLDGDRLADLVVGAGTGAGSRVTGYYGKDMAGGATPEAFGFDAFPGSLDGVFVG